MTVGQKWRRKRDMVIAHASAVFSARYLADVFDLPRSRIAVIIAERKTAHARIPKSSAVEPSQLRIDRRKVARHYRVE
jgi:hypothetical protein